MDNYVKCINCDNHEDYEMACKLKHPNYKKRRSDATTDLTECFVKSKLHASMDKAIELTDKLISKIEKGA